MQYIEALSGSRLTKDILDVTRIESHTLHLNKELLNLNNVIANIVLDVKRQNISTAKGKVSVTYNADEDRRANNRAIFINADKERITQVLYNLLDNAVK